MFIHPLNADILISQEYINLLCEQFDYQNIKKVGYEKFNIPLSILTGDSLSMKLLYREDEMIVVVFCTLLRSAYRMLLALVVFEQPLQWHLLNKNYDLVWHL
jgi:hypothetical protein